VRERRAAQVIRETWPVWHRGRESVRAGRDRQENQDQETYSTVFKTWVIDMIRHEREQVENENGGEGRGRDKQAGVL